MITRSNRFRARGFSLPEVTIAVGIAALGLISLLGLMPQGLEMARKTGEMAARRHILEQIAKDLEQTPWKDLQVMVAQPKVRLFDDQGVEVIGANNPNVSYVAGVAVEDPQYAHLPQQTGGQVGEKYLRRAIIRIATSTNPGFDFSEGNSARYATFNTYIAKSR